MKKPNAIIVDLDGTLAIFEGIRDGLDFSNLLNDKVNQPIKKFYLCIKNIIKKIKL